MKITFLGTGTSQGVPVIGCRCEVCTSADPRDHRLRTSAFVEVDGVHILIDAGPDFRYQMLREGIRRVDALLLTHEHKDHTGGIDDVRALNFVDYPDIHPITIYGMAATLNAVRKDYDYAFSAKPYRGVPVINLVELSWGQDFEVCGHVITPIRGGHSVRFNVTGYRIGKLAYLTDFKTIEDVEVAKLQGLDVLVVNALRWQPHDSHFSIDEALELISRVKPKRAYLTHMSHEVGLFDSVESKLPEGVFLAHDRLSVEF